MTQYARPSADDATGGWGAATLHSKLQTYPWWLPTSANFIESPNGATGTDGQCVKFSLNSVIDPGTNEGHRLRVVWYRTGAGPVTGAVELYQGASTLIATLTNAAVGSGGTSNAHIDQYLLSTTEAGNITDYSDLNIWIRPSGSTDLRVRGVELELPSAPLLSLPAGVPHDVYASYDASTFDLDEGDPIDAWQDESGNGRSLVSRPDGKPSYNASASEVAGGKPCVYFDGVDDRLAVAWGETIEEPFTWVFSLVPRSFTSSSATQTCVIAAGDADLWDTLNVTHVTQKFAMINENITTTPDTTQASPDWMITQTAAQHAVGGTPVLDQHHVIVIRWVAGEDEIWQDGVMVVQSDADHEPMVGIRVGCREPSDGGDRHTNMDVRRVIIYDRAVTDQEITDISSALAAELDVVPSTYHRHV
jgi:hypothetical protein